jgi:imidazoleglycerol phosphate dehydratase HisB
MFCLENKIFTNQDPADFDTVTVLNGFGLFAINAGITVHVETLYGDKQPPYCRKSCFQDRRRGYALRYAIVPTRRVDSFNQRSLSDAAVDTVSSKVALAALIRGEWMRSDLCAKA